MMFDLAMTLQNSKLELFDAALPVVRTTGYTATRAEDLRSEAGVSKGSFFHHFKSKDDLTLVAIVHWGSVTGEFLPRPPTTI